MQDNFKADASGADASNNDQKGEALNEALRQIIEESVFAGANIAETKAKIKVEAKAEAKALRHLLNKIARAGATIVTIMCFILGLWIGWIAGNHDQRIGLLEQNLVLAETHLPAVEATRESSGEPQAVGDEVTIH